MYADFDFLAGDWHVVHRRRREPLCGREDWYQFEGGAQAYSLLHGAVSVDEIELEEGHAGMSVRMRDPDSDRWTIYWVNSADGGLQPPVVGTWADGRFEAFGEDEYRQMRIQARYRWFDLSPRRATWEQAFSIDEGSSWEANWLMKWTRRT